MNACAATLRPAGSLSQQQTKRALDHAGYKLDENAFAALFKSFDPDRRAL